MIRLILSICLLAVHFAGHAHGFRVGELRIDHPYATPSRPGVQTGAVYFRSLDNRGRTADRLLSASTPVAERVEIHQMHMDGDIMRMRAVPDLELPARTAVQMRHHTPNGHHLMLLNLKVPLNDGDRFPLTLHFEKAGSYTVQVWVQTPRDADHQHQH